MRSGPNTGVQPDLSTYGKDAGTPGSVTVMGGGCVGAGRFGESRGVASESMYRCQSASRVVMSSPNADWKAEKTRSP